VRATRLTTHVEHTPHPEPGGASDNADSADEGAHVVAVIVTRHRPDTLPRSLRALSSQRRRPDHVVVVDNGPDAEVSDLLADAGLPWTYLPSQRNLGGAGGFALGILHALALGADWVWLADDDGYPVGDGVLDTLLATARAHRLGMVSPLVVDADDHDRLVFPLLRAFSWAPARDELGDGMLPGYAALFNGALFSAGALERVGVPDLRLFVRGDEVDMHRRVTRSGVAFGTALDAAYAHPTGQLEWRETLGGRTRVLVPDDDTKRFFTFRNRGFLTSQPGMRRYAAFDLLRYAWYFLAQRRDPAAFRDWVRLTREGRAERFSRPG
jgi:rhamnopyranosyl-N-acetylglucosaminyl-diphospho-decaprenol beta-1,3/1,4-galactofuranosyltransferase